MKKIVYSFIAFLALAVSISSCKKDYLDTVPTSAVSADVVTASADNMLLALNGIHRSMYIRYNSQGEGGYGGIMIINDMLGEDLVMTEAGNGWYNNIYKWADHRNPTDGDLLYPWRVYYRIIANANVLINGSGAATGDPAKIKAIVGQALVYRAWAHFQLVQLYAKRYNTGGGNTQLGVPIMLENTTAGLARSTVEEVYTAINTDLASAVTNLTGYVRPNKSHFSVEVVKGIQARVALTQGKYAEAATLAAAARTGFALMNAATYKLGFNDYKVSEWMWGSNLIEDQTTYFAHFGAYMSRNFSSTNIRTNPKAMNSLLFNALPATDARRQLVSATGNDHVFPAGYTAMTSSFLKRPYTSQKFLAYGPSDSRMDVPYMRSGEMYLIEAEAKARLAAQDAAGAQQALYDLNITRDPSYVKSTLTGQALIDHIMIYRRAELWGEGFRFNDLKRLNLALDRTGANHKDALTAGLFSVPAGDIRWEWLIPQSELDANELMVQNPL
ncbi:MAG: RagB/SusD family nutrient uptake outer membrane protein [Bacteroidota bacterium]|jgi:hypothetical protein